MCFEGECKLASEIRFVQRGRRCELTIDGEPFRFFLAEEPIETKLDPGGLPTIRLTLIAEKVVMEDDNVPVEEPKPDPAEERAMRLQAAAFGAAKRAPS